MNFLCDFLSMLCILVSFFAALVQIYKSLLWLERKLSEKMHQEMGLTQDGIMVLN